MSETLKHTRYGRKSVHFTLVELLVVIAIITILAGLLLPALQRAIYEAKMVSDISNHKQIAVGVIAYTSDNNGYYPTTRKVGWRQGPWNPIRYEGSEPTIDYRADLMEYFGGSVGGVWTCPLATHDWQGNGGFRKGGGENGKDLDDMNLKGTRISYNFYFGRTGGPDAWAPMSAGGWDKPYGGGCELTPDKSMLKVGQPMEYNNWAHYTGVSRTNLPVALRPGRSHVLSSDVYLRNHSGARWRFVHQGIGGSPMENYARFGEGYSDGQEGSMGTPGVAFYDYAYAKDDGSARALRELTALDPRTAEAQGWLIPNPND